MTNIAASAPATVSHFTGAPDASAAEPAVPGPSEACPLCGTPLHSEQEWCLRCGAAARTRLAATPNWRVPLAAILAAVAISLGVLAAALIDLAGSSSATKTVVVRTVTAPAAASGPSAVSPVPTTAAPATTVPGTTATGATGTATAPGAVPGTGTGTARTATPGSGGTGGVLPGVTRTGTGSGTAPR